MTIASFCRDELLAHGPLSLDDLTARAVDAGVTRSCNPKSSVSNALHPSAVELLDGRWVTPLWLLEGRCLTATRLPYARLWYGEMDADLGLLTVDVPTDPGTWPVDDEETVRCVRVSAGKLETSTMPTPDVGTLEVAALAERLAAITPVTEPHRDLRRAGLRAVAQLMVDDPSTFRTPLPPLSRWVPALVEDARRREEEAREQEEWWYEQQRRQSRQVILDDCTAIDVQLAAERAGQSIRGWIAGAIDQALAAQQPRAVGQDAVVISFDKKWR